jgi:lysozyme family protein
MNFDDAFKALIGHEGAYLSAEAARRQGDSGGETKFGISKAAYPSLDIANLTLAECKAIYKRDYWGPAGCDAVPEAIKFDLFDTAVNSGVRSAVRLLQKAVGEAEDGVLGPKTLQAVQSMPPDRLRLRFSACRRLLWSSLSTWPAFGRGWTIRQAKNDLLP